MIIIHAKLRYLCHRPKSIFKVVYLQHVLPVLDNRNNIKSWLQKRVRFFQVNMRRKHDIPLLFSVHSLPGRRISLAVAFFYLHKNQVFFIAADQINLQFSNTIISKKYFESFFLQIFGGLILSLYSFRSVFRFI